MNNEYCTVTNKKRYDEFMGWYNAANFLNLLIIMTMIIGILQTALLITLKLVNILILAVIPIITIPFLITFHTHMKKTEVYNLKISTMESITAEETQNAKRIFRSLTFKFLVISMINLIIISVMTTM